MPVSRSRRCGQSSNSLSPLVLPGLFCLLVMVPIVPQVNTMPMCSKNPIVTIGNQKFYDFMYFESKNIDCSPEWLDTPLKVGNLNLPQIKCKSCGEECWGKEGKCTQLYKEIGEGEDRVEWLVGCVCLRSTGPTVVSV